MSEKTTRNGKVLRGEEGIGWEIRPLLCGCEAKLHVFRMGVENI